MSKIKTREIVEKGIKTLDKAAVAGERMKNAYIRTKEEALGTAEPNQGSVTEYAVDKVERAAEDLARKTGQGTEKAVQRGREAFKKQREKASQEKRQSVSQPDTIPEGPPRPWQLENVTAPSDHLPQATPEPRYREAKQTPEQAELRREFAKERMESIRHRNAAPERTAPEADRKMPKNRSHIQEPEIKSKTSVEKAPLRKERQLTETSTRKTTRSVRKVSIRNTEHTVKTARKSIKATDKTVKTAQKSSKAAVKTAQRILSRFVRIAMQRCTYLISRKMSKNCKKLSNPRQKYRFLKTIMQKEPPHEQHSPRHKRLAQHHS